jgi:plastin-1
VEGNFVEMAHSSKAGGSHAIPDDEKSSFVEYINGVLGGDEHCQHLLPISAEGNELFEKCGDGIVLVKLINAAVPDTIDLRVMNKAKKGSVGVFQKVENGNLVISSAKAIGCRGVYTGAQDIIEGVPHLVMGLLWQIIRVRTLTCLLRSAGLAHAFAAGSRLQD